tara:strand:+ start:28575 stop:29816 length:1242 start_codon:yes stop_codon:yes gene_type:complete
MNSDYYKRKKCRQCNSTNLSVAIKLKPTPLANDYSKEVNNEYSKKTYPLEVFFCDQCKHLQLLDVVNPKVLFDNYVYVSGTSPVFVEHFKSYAESLSQNYSNDGFVIDIGSNDGTLLKAFKTLGYKVLGIEPAEKIALEAIKNKIETLIEFFNPELAYSISCKYGKANIITANNVFAHIDNPTQFLNGIKALLLKENGIFVFEVSYLKDVIKHTFFDTIYHEHLDYHTLLPLKAFFERSGFEIIDAIHVNTHGGSLRVISQIKGGQYKISENINKLISEEELLGLHELKTYKEFSEKIDKTGIELKETLLRIKSEGKSIIGYGAPAKATTLMHHFEIGSEIIDFIIDDSPWKQFLYTPGKNIPIYPSSYIQDKKPDYILILAWNFASSIIKNNIEFQSKGGKFIIPLPNLEIV